MADQFELKAIKINGESVTSSAEALNNQHMNITQSKFGFPSMQSRMHYGGPPVNLGGPHHVNPKESKNYDHDFGFNIFKLSKGEANRVANLLIKDAQKHVGPRCK